MLIVAKGKETKEEGMHERANQHKRNDPSPRVMGPPANIRNMESTHPFSYIVRSVKWDYTVLKEIALSIGSYLMNKFGEVYLVTMVHSPLFRHH